MVVRLNIFPDDSRLLRVRPVLELNTTRIRSRFAGGFDRFSFSGKKTGAKDDGPKSRGNWVESIRVFIFIYTRIEDSVPMKEVRVDPFNFHSRIKTIRYILVLMNTCEVSRGSVTRVLLRIFAFVRSSSVVELFHRHRDLHKTYRTIRYTTNRKKRSVLEIASRVSVNLSEKYDQSRLIHTVHTMFLVEGNHDLPNRVPSISNRRDSTRT